MERQSVLDRKGSHVLGFPLTIRQQLWLSFLLPSISLLCLYIADISTDITTAVLLIDEGLHLQALLTIIIIYGPPLLTYLARLSNPPDTKSVKVVYAWFFTETAAFIIFPIRILQCIGERIFWSIEALRLDEPEREEALEEYEKTRCHLIENYLFTQAYLQAIPQAILQALLLALHLSSRLDTEIMQGACVLSSLGTVALVTSWYERYQRQVGGGRYQVWSPITPEPSKAMEDDNPIGSLVSFTAWFFFVTARLTSLVMAAYFYPKTTAAVIGAHFILSLIYLFSLPPYTKPLLFKISVSLIYIFSIVEVQIQLRKTKIFYAVYFLLTSLENTFLTVLWTTQARWRGTYYQASIYIIVISHGLAILSFLIYHICLKPRARRIDG